MGPRSDRVERAEEQDYYSNDDETAPDYGEKEEEEEVGEDYVGNPKSSSQENAGKFCAGLQSWA